MDFNNERIQTGGNAETIIHIGEKEPIDKDIKLWFNTDMASTRATEVDLYYPVGSYYETSNIEFNPNVKWGGAWEKEEDGTVLASKSTTVDSLLNTNVGDVVGEDKHALTIDETPNHGHISKIATKLGDSGGANYFFNPDGATSSPESVSSVWSSSINTLKTGGDQPHNNIQRTKICVRWHRIA